jgi:hypothetical protein
MEQEFQMNFNFSQTFQFGFNRDLLSYLFVFQLIIFNFSLEIR